MLQQDTGDGVDISRPQSLPVGIDLINTHGLGHGDPQHTIVIASVCGTDFILGDTLFKAFIAILSLPDSTDAIRTSATAADSSSAGVTTKFWLTTSMHRDKRFQSVKLR